MNTQTRADRLFEALRKLVGAQDIGEATALLAVSRQIAGEEAETACDALTVLIAEWPTNPQI
jgi:hypothetical protein